MKIIQVIQRVAHIVVVLSFMYIVFLHQVGMLQWHLVNENPVLHRGWEVHVPWWWRGRTNFSSYSISKPPIFYWNDASAVITLLPSDAPLFLEMWIDDVSIGLQVDGYANLQTKTFIVDSVKTHCIQGTSKIDSEQVKVECILDDGTLAYFYYGSSKYLPILEKLQKTIRKIE